jgi:hypothetical protein
MPENGLLSARTMAVLVAVLVLAYSGQPSGEQRVTL